MSGSNRNSSAQTHLDDGSGSALQAQHDVIGQKLRDLYNDVVEEGIPDAFAQLLDQLDESQSKKGQD